MPRDDDNDPYWKGYAAAIDDTEVAVENEKDILRWIHNVRKLFDLPAGESFRGN